MTVVAEQGHSEGIRAERTAQAASQRFESVLRGATECSIIATDLDGTITVFNAGAERMLGYRADELIGNATFARLHDSAELAARAAELKLATPRAALVAAARRGEAETREWTYIRKDGARLLVSVSVTGMRDEDGSLVGFIGIATDISERKAVEQMKDQFVSMVSHELRTPMNGVIAMAELLLETDLKDDQREFAETIHDSGRTLVVIVNDILDLARLQAGQVEFENIELDVRSVVDHVVDLLVTPARRKGVELVGIVDRAVPRLLCGDPGRLRQVLTNLIANAIKFTDAGEVSARVSVASETQRDLVLLCEVKDTGIGIAAETMEHLFEPFRQADSSVTRRYGGTGLGLAICKRLVDGLGGEISVSSQIGSGSSFGFTVTLSKPDAAPAPGERFAPARRHARDAAVSSSIRADAPLVVVVDDVEVNRRVAERMLARLGYRTQTADGGRAALEILTRTECAAILMDCRMPDMDGAAATTEIRRREGAMRHTPIIAMTAHAQNSDRDRCLSQGMDDYMSKPVELAIVARLLARWAPMPTTAPVGAPDAVEVGTAERVLDPKVLAQILALEEPGEPSLLVELIDAFRNSSAGYLVKLTGALQTGDHETVLDVAHTLKGAAAALGAERVRAIAWALEMRGRQHSLAGAEGQLAILEIARDQALAALSEEAARAA
jgi:PAS domain S-box-containing protein